MVHGATNQHGDGNDLALRCYASGTTSTDAREEDHDTLPFERGRTEHAAETRGAPVARQRDAPRLLEYTPGILEAESAGILTSGLRQPERACPERVRASERGERDAEPDGVHQTGQATVRVGEELCDEVGRGRGEVSGL